MKYEEEDQQLSISDIEKFENLLNVILPNSFKDHYMAHNGGYPVGIDRIIGKDRIFPLHGFIPLKYGDITIETLINDLEEGFDLSDVIPFAHDQGSNIFYMSLKSSEFGKIFIITAEDQCKFFVCDTFSDFLNGFSTKGE